MIGRGRRPDEAAASEQVHGQAGLSAARNIGRSDGKRHRDARHGREEKHGLCRRDAVPGRARSLVGIRALVARSVDGGNDVIVRDAGHDAGVEIGEGGEKGRVHSVVWSSCSGTPVQVIGCCRDALIQPLGIQPAFRQGGDGEDPRCGRRSDRDRGHCRIRRLAFIPHSVHSGNTVRVRAVRKQDVRVQGPCNEGCIDLDPALGCRAIDVVACRIRLGICRPGQDHVGVDCHGSKSLRGRRRDDVAHQCACRIGAAALETVLVNGRDRIRVLLVGQVEVNEGRRNDRVVLRHGDLREPHLVRAARVRRCGDHDPDPISPVCRSEGKGVLLRAIPRRLHLGHPRISGPDLYLEVFPCIQNFIPGAVGVAAPADIQAADEFRRCQIHLPPDRRLRQGARFGRPV